MKVKEESEKLGLKLNIQKTKIMATDAITAWQIGGETIETDLGFYLSFIVSVQPYNNFRVFSHLQIWKYSGKWSHLPAVPHTTGKWKNGI